MSSAIQYRIVYPLKNNASKLSLLAFFMPNGLTRIDKTPLLLQSLN